MFFRMPSENADPRRSIMKEDIYVVCPNCGRISNSIKCYDLPYLFLFLFVYVREQTITCTCCPHCMRKMILKYCCTYNILAANLCWPLFVFPWGLFQFIRSYTHGHSDEVVAIIRKESKNFDPQGINKNQL